MYIEQEVMAGRLYTVAVESLSRLTPTINLSHFCVLGRQVMCLQFNPRVSPRALIVKLMISQLK